jgi:hypothetical protein
MTLGHLVTMVQCASLPKQRGRGGGNGGANSILMMHWMATTPLFVFYHACLGKYNIDVLMIVDQKSELPTY